MRRFLHFIRTRIANQRVTPAAKPQPATLRYNIENVTADADFVRIRGWAWSLLQSPEELQSSQIRITVTDADGRPVPFEKQIQSRPDVAEDFSAGSLALKPVFVQDPPPPQGQVDEGGDHGYSDQRHTKAGGIGLFMVIVPPTPRPSWGDSRSLSFADDPIVHSVLSAICLGIRPGNHMNHQRVTALERISSD